MTALRIFLLLLLVGATIPTLNIGTIISPLPGQQTISVVGSSTNLEAIFMFQLINFHLWPLT